MLLALLLALLVLILVLILLLLLLLLLALPLWWCRCCCCRRHYCYSSYGCYCPQCLCLQPVVLVLVQLQHPRQRQRLQQLLAWRRERRESLQRKCDLVLASLNQYQPAAKCPSLLIRLSASFLSYSPVWRLVLSIRDGQVRWASWAVVYTAKLLARRSIGCARDGRDMNDAAAARPGSRGG